MEKQEGKKLTKKGGTKKREAAKIRPPQAPPKEGMCLAGYGMLWVGDIKEKRFKPQRLRFNSQRSKVFEVKICFVAHNSPIC